MSRTSRVLASAGLGYVQIVLSTLSALWFTPFLLRHIGQADFGLWSVGLPLLSYVALVDFGVMTVFQREVAFAIGAATGDYRAVHDLWERTGKTLRLVLYQMPVLVVVVVIALWLLPSDWRGLRVPLTIIFGCFLVTFPLRIFHALITGLQDLQFLGVVALANLTLGLVANVVLVTLGWGLCALATSWAITQLATYACCFLRVRAKFPGATRSGLPPLSPGDAKVRLTKGFWVVVAQAAVMILGSVDIVVIGASLGPSAVTPYAITEKLVTMLANIPLLVMAAAQPGLSELSTSTDRHRLADVCIALMRVILLVSGAIAIVVVSTDHGFVDWWVGDRQYAGDLLVILFVLNMAVAHWTAATNYTLFSFGYERLLSITSILNGAFTFGATVLFTRRWGMEGAASASILGNALVVLPVQLVAVARETGTTVTVLLRSIFAWAWRLTTLGIAASLAFTTFLPRSVLALCAVGSVVTAFYVVVMLPLAVEPPLGNYLLPRMSALRARVLGAKSIQS